MLVTLYLLWIVLVCIGIGYNIVRWLGWDGGRSTTIALSYYAGFAVTGSSFVLLGLIGKFNTFWLIVVLVLFSIVASYRLPQLFKLMRQQRLAFTPWSLPVVLIGVVIVGANYLACFAPPTARDAISYHVPNAQAIVNSEQLSFPLGGHLFYGNIPVFMEVVYAAGISLGGFTLAQLLHYSLYISFLVFLFGWLRRHYSLMTAAWGIVAVPLLHTMLSTAISLDIDASHMVLEVTAVLLVIDWVMEQRLANLRVAGMVLGLALAIKYSPLATVGLLGIMIGLTLIVRRYQWKKAIWSLLHFIVPLVVVAGFWYIKNAILLHNPLYPLYFGHAGYDDVQFQSLIAAIQDFRVPRTFLNWLLLPINVYWPGNTLAAVFARPEPLFIWIALASLPLLLFLKKNYWRHGLLISYALAFSAYWFFLATHQSRFLGPANVILVILAVIALTQLPRHWGLKLVGGLVIGVIIVLLITGTFRYAGNLAFVGVRNYVVHWSEVKYALGISTKAEYLHDYLDCGIDAAYYLEEQKLTAAVLDNWTVWHNHHFKYYAHSNIYLSLPPDLSTEQVNQFIADNQIRYVYFNTESKQDFAVTADVTQQAHYAARIQQEDTLLHDAKLLYSYETCQLYQLP